MFYLFFQAEDGIRAAHEGLEFRRVLFRSANLSPTEAEALFAKVVGGRWTPADAELFRAQMLTELAAMSVEDGMVMQIHPGACRNHNHKLFESHGRDKGCDIPRSEEHTSELQSLMRISYAVFCLKKNKLNKTTKRTTNNRETHRKNV